MPPSRILFLALLAACSPAASPHSPSPAPVPAEWVEARELTADQQVAHALNRLAFGARPGDPARVRAMGVDNWIALQLQPERIDNRALDSFVAGAFPSLARSAAELIRESPPPNQVRRQVARGGDMMSGADSARVREAARAAQRIVAELGSAKVARAVASERQLEEVMVDFWENHFSVFVGKGSQMRYQMVEYGRDAIRPHALGSFRDLLGAVAKSPAMLFYLDNWQSTAELSRPTQGRRRGLNENYARELLELHTVGVDGGYSQTDVIEVARALTGWSIRQPAQGGDFVFRPAMHDAGEKVVLGHRLKAGRGIEDGEEVLDILARHPSTARHIATRLARRFVSDTPPAELVARAAETFRRTNGDIRETVRIIIASPEFWSIAAYRSKVKSPFETVVSAMRAMNAPPDSSPRTARAIANLGQPIYGHQAPNGWPETANEWINTGAILNRINFGVAVGAGRLPGARVRDLPGASALRDATREHQVDAVIAMFLAGAVSSDTRAILMSGENPLAGAATGNTLSGLDQIVGLAIGSPEFQRR